MRLRLTRARRLLFDVPKLAKLTYCLVRDDRVPPAPKAALLGAFGLIASPVRLWGRLPVLGELDFLALGVLTVKVFIDACPERVVREHESALQQGDSTFDHDLAAALRAASEVVGSAFERLGMESPEQAAPRPRHLNLVEDESA